MLLLKLKKVLMEQDTGTGGSASDAGTNNTGATDNTGNNPEPASSGSLQDIMASSDTGSTQNKPEGETGTNDADNAGNTNNDSQPAWMEQLPTEMRTDELKQYGKISDMVNAFNELKAKGNENSQVLSPDAKPEEVQAFYEKLGKPKTADAYSFEYPKENEEGAKLFKETAFKANLTDEQAKSVYASLNEIAQQQMELQKAAVKQTYVETEKALRAEYGDKYNEKLTLLQRGLKTYATPELRNKLDQYGMTFDRDLIKLFITLGAASAEAGTTQNGTGSKSYIPLSEGGMFEFKE